MRQLVSGLRGPGEVAVALACLPGRMDGWNLLYAQINQGLLIPECLTTNVPDWWTPGQSLVSAVDALSAQYFELWFFSRANAPTYPKTS